jgi:hypothetical protein
VVLLKLPQLLRPPPNLLPRLPQELPRLPEVLQHQEPLWLLRVLRRLLQRLLTLLKLLVPLPQRPLPQAECKLFTF